MKKKQQQTLTLLQDGVEYTLVKAKNRPAKRRPSENQRLNSALMKLTHRYVNLHSHLLEQSIAHKGRASARSVFVHLNHTHLKAIFTPLAQAMLKGTPVDDQLLDEAVSRYAADHPKSVIILNLPGYEEVFLGGPFPKELEMVRVEMREHLVKVREAVRVRVGVIR